MLSKRHYSFFLWLLFSCFCLLSSINANIIHVPDDTLSIQGGISLAGEGDTVLVAEGLYYENINFRGKAITVASLFLNDEDTSHISRTIIDGSQNAHPDSGSVVYMITGEDTTSILCGFTITGGSGTTILDGIYHIRVGGGILCFSGARIEWNIIENNQLTTSPWAVGGGISLGRPGPLIYTIIQHNIIRSNRVYGTSGWGQGGGINAYNANGRIRFNQITGNECHSVDSAAIGGGIRLLSPTAPFPVCLLEDNLISDNLSESDNYIAYAGGISTSGNHLQMISNRIINNTVRAESSTSASFGGGMQIGLLRFGESRIEGNIFKGNINTGNWPVGGAIYIYFSHPDLINNIISGNQASYAGGIFVDYSSHNEIINNTIAGNTGGGISVDETATPVLLNNILWDNYPFQIEGNVRAYYSIIMGNWPGTGNIDVNPLFSDSTFHLSDISYCIGLGRATLSLEDGIYRAPSFDLEGNPRPGSIDTLPDMGAFETSQPARAQLVASLVNNNFSYIHPLHDSIHVGVQIFNPHQQNMSLYTRLFNLQGALYDETQLFDDGMHGDSASGDDFYGATLIPVMLEDAFQLHHQLVYDDFQQALTYPENRRLTSIGPLACENYRIISQSGNRLQLELTLRNAGQTASAPNVRAELIPADSNSCSVINNNQYFGTIEAGTTAVNSTPYIIDTIDNLQELYFTVIIKSDGYPYWESRDVLVGMEPADKTVPSKFALLQNHPNPFNPITTIEFTIPQAGFITMKVYNLLGEEVATLLSASLLSGSYKYEWDATGMASGVYFYKLEGGKFTECRKMLLLR
jgi:parallel beta-helix repeat protein